MAAVVQDEPVVGTNDAQKVRAESHRHAHHADQRPRRRIAGDLFGLQRHRPQEPQVVGRRTEDIGVPARPRPLDRRFGMVEGQSEPKNFLLTGRRAEAFLKQADISQIDVMLINHQPVQFHHAELRRDGVEAVLDQWVAQDLFL